ncbi:MAG: virulence protein, partial [Anaerobutyricum sp.]
EETISFPWFSNCNADSVTPYTRFIAAICDMAKNQKRITAKPKENENEKYAFRCFLLRLGFIGDEYKTDRKVLLANLDGSSAFKAGAKKGGEQ